MKPECKELIISAIVGACIPVVIYLILHYVTPLHGKCFFNDFVCIARAEEVLK